MTSAVEATAVIDGETMSNALKRRRSSNVISNETETEPMLFKRVRSTSPSSTIPTDPNQQQIHSMFTCLADIVQNHRNLVREYVDLQIGYCADPSSDEQRFIQAEEDLIEKAEKNLCDVNQGTCNSSIRQGKRQRLQSASGISPSLDRAKHETHILKRIEELKSDGKWTPHRLAKCLEPVKRKTHWDYLLDEMRWLSEDFILEKRWKQMMAKKISLAVMKYFQNRNQNGSEQQRDVERLRRKQAQFVSREVMQFWKNIYTIAEYQEAARSRELYQYQLDVQMTQSNDEQDLDDGSMNGSCYLSDDNDENSTDDEETIEREEQEPSYEDYRDELNDLQADQQESIETVLQRRYGIDSIEKLSQEKLLLGETVEKDEENSRMSDDETGGFFFDEELFPNRVDVTLSEEPTLTDRISIDEQMKQLRDLAESFQPTGVEFKTTLVRNSLPYLLKKPLREYQHIGIDWLIAGYEHKFNSILADETGLGKRNQRQTDDF